MKAKFNQSENQTILRLLLGSFLVNVMIYVMICSQIILMTVD